MNSLHFRGLIFLFIILQICSLEAQDVPEYNYTISAKSKLWFEGTSTLHDYKCIAGEISGSFLLNRMISDSKPTGFNTESFAGVVQIPVLSIKSGKESLDENMQESLKAEEYPEIIFELGSAELAGIPETGNPHVQLNAMGNLSVAGVEKVIQLEIMGNLEPNGTLLFTGRKELLMTDFDIEPPTMFLGVLKTANEIMVHFELVLVPSNNIVQNQIQDAN